ncbi:hypothetical protein F383_30031 [Gossypium arboreum]|uniref:Uncharacterized protein n=1 Tax=Gossypium arboreum TaxID=29729 RepID=A0A0B0PKE7_GOSAR|nr:hypothetical protein F383_30031 [Gossypium arboreum]
MRLTSPSPVYRGIFATFLVGTVAAARKKVAAARKKVAAASA